MDLSTIAGAEEGELHLCTRKPCLLQSCGAAGLCWLAACSVCLSQKKLLLAASLALPAQPAWGRGLRGSWRADLRAKFLGSPGDVHRGLGSSSACLDKQELTAPWGQSRAPWSCCYCFCPGLAQTLWPFPLLLFFSVGFCSSPACRLHGLGSPKHTCVLMKQKDNSAL